MVCCICGYITDSFFPWNARQAERRERPRDQFYLFWQIPGYTRLPWTRNHSGVYLIKQQLLTMQQWTDLFGKVKHWRLRTRVVHVSGQLCHVLDHRNKVVQQSPHGFLHHVTDILWTQRKQMAYEATNSRFLQRKTNKLLFTFPTAVQIVYYVSLLERLKWCKHYYWVVKLCNNNYQHAREIKQILHMIS